jgi:hypothetical protein
MDWSYGKNHEYMDGVVTVMRRSADYMAYIDGDEHIWGAGRTPHEAVGDVCIYHPDAVAKAFLRRTISAETPPTPAAPDPLANYVDPYRCPECGYCRDTPQHELGCEGKPNPQGEPTTPDPRNKVLQEACKLVIIGDEMELRGCPPVLVGQYNEQAKKVRDATKEFVAALQATPRKYAGEGAIDHAG